MHLETHISPVLMEERLKRFTNACRERNLRITPQRLEIFRELAGTSSHPSAEEIFERVRLKMPTVSLDTVYRTMTTLSDAGIVSRVEVLDDKSRFDANLDRHHHFICVRCKKIVDFDWPEFDHIKIPQKLKEIGKIEHPQAELRGICNECLQS